MSRKFVVLPSILMVLAFVSIITPVHAVGTRTIILGEVTHARVGNPGADPISSDGRISIFAIDEPDKARVSVQFYIPTDEKRVLIKLVSVDSVEIDSTSVTIEGYWDVYVNGMLSKDDTYGRLDGPIGIDKFGIDIDQDVPDVGTPNAYTKVKGEVIWYRYFG